jgi:uncharacterized protein
MNKRYITAQQLLNDAFEIALKIAESNFKPDLIIGVWRGGTPVAITIHEVLEFIGVRCDHIAIRTSSYTGIGERTNVTVHGLEYLEKKLTAIDYLLIVDDVFDTGQSLDELIEQLKKLYKEKMPEIKIAVPYFKPENNKTKRIPDFYNHETDLWLVFPHELQGLKDEEILEEKPGINVIKKQLLKLREQNKNQ